jgi:hypothetical protein
MLSAACCSLINVRPYAESLTCAHTDPLGPSGTPPRQRSRRPRCCRGNGRERRCRRRRGVHNGSGRGGHGRRHGRRRRLRGRLLLEKSCPSKWMLLHMNSRHETQSSQCHCLHMTPNGGPQVRPVFLALSPLMLEVTIKMPSAGLTDLPLDTQRRSPVRRRA